MHPRFRIRGSSAQDPSSPSIKPGNSGKNLEKSTRSQPQPGKYGPQPGIFELRPGCFRAGSRVFRRRPGIFSGGLPEFELKPEVFSKFYPQPGRVPGPQQPGRVLAAEKKL